MYISAGWTDKDSLSLSLCLSEKNRTYMGYRTYVYFSMKQNVEKKLSALAKSWDGARCSVWTSDQWLWRQILYYILVMYTGLNIVWKTNTMILFK